MILALDYGEKRIGVAITDDSEKFVRALDFIPNKSELKKVFEKDFPNGTPQEVIHEARRQAKRESRIEFQKLCNKLIYLINIHYPEKLLIGIPLIQNMETGEVMLGVQAKKIQLFGKKLQHSLNRSGIDIKIEFVEESMTSQIAQKRLQDQGVPLSRIVKTIDSESARVLLEEYLEKKTNEVKQ